MTLRELLIRELKGNNEILDVSIRGGENDDSYCIDMYISSVDDIDCWLLKSINSERVYTYNYFDGDCGVTLVTTLVNKGGN